MCPAAMVAMAVISAAAAAKAAHDQQKQAGRALNASEAGRQEGKAAMAASRTKAVGDWMFPGLLSSSGVPEGSPSVGVQQQMPNWLNGGAQAGLRAYMGDRETGPPQGLANVLAPHGYGSSLFQPSAQPAAVAPSIPTRTENTGVAADPYGLAGHRAAGGPVQGNKPYLVGEKGPEIIQPKTAGQVIPADETAAMVPGEDDGAMGDPEDAAEGGGADEDPKTQQLLQMILMLLTHVLGGGPQGGASMGAPGAAPMGGPPPGPMAAGGMPPMGAQPRAGGGPVSAGGMYQVGERGPETVVPGPSAPGQVGGPTPYTPPITGVADPTTPMPTANAPILPGALANPSAPAGSPPPGQPTGVPGAPGVSGAPGAAGAPGTPGTATATPGTLGTPEGASYGSLAVSQNKNLLANPGQTSTIGFERAQEQSNQGLAVGARGVTGGLSAGGIDPNTPMGQALMASVTATAGKQRNEAARDQTTLEEGLRRQDIALATQRYLDMLTTLFGYQQAQSAAAAGTQFPPVPVTQSPWNAVANGVSQLGSDFANRNSSQGGGSSNTMPGATYGNTV